MTTEEKIRTECPSCGQRMRIKTKYDGKAIPCPTCKNPFVVKPIAEDDGGMGTELPAVTAAGDEVPPWGDPNEADEAMRGDFDDAPADAFPPMNGDADVPGFNEAVASLQESEGDEFAGGNEGQLVEDLPPIEEGDDMNDAEQYSALTDQSLAADHEDNDMHEPIALDESRGARTATMRRGRLTTAGSADGEPPMPSEIEPSKHFAPLVSDQEAALGEYKLGRAGLLTPEQTRLLVTDKNLYVKRTRRQLFGLIPGADSWTAAYPLDSYDLRHLRVYLPSIGRMLLLLVLALAIGGLAFFGMWDIQQHESGQAEKLLVSRADLEAVEGDVIQPIAQWYLAQVDAFDLNQIGTWYGTLIPFLVVLLWYAWRFKARFESDAFRLPIGRGIRKVRAARDAMQLILQQRARLQNRRSY